MAATSAPGVATYMALSQPDRVIGIHLSTPEMWPYTGLGARPLSVEEQSYLDHVARWEERSAATARCSPPGRKRWGTG